MRPFSASPTFLLIGRGHLVTGRAVVEWRHRCDGDTAPTCLGAGAITAFNHAVGKTGWLLGRKGDQCGQSYDKCAVLSLFDIVFSAYVLYDVRVQWGSFWPCDFPWKGKGLMVSTVLPLLTYVGKLTYQRAHMHTHTKILYPTCSHTQESSTCPVATDKGRWRHSQRHKHWLARFGHQTASPQLPSSVVSREQTPTSGVCTWKWMEEGHEQWPLVFHRMETSQGQQKL